MKKIGMKIHQTTVSAINLQFGEYVKAWFMGIRKDIRMTNVRFYSVTADQIGIFGGFGKRSR